MEVFLHFHTDLLTIKIFMNMYEWITLLGLARNLIFRLLYMPNLPHDLITNRKKTTGSRLGYIAYHNGIRSYQGRFLIQILEVHTSLTWFYKTCK